MKKNKQIIIVFMLICIVTLCIWGINKVHNSSRQTDNTAEQNNNTTKYQTETTTQMNTETDPEEEHLKNFEEDTSEEKLLEKAVKELTQEEKKSNADNDKAIQCYIRFLNGNPADKYDIVDIDGDGIAEFFTLNEGAGATMYRYNAKKDKVRELHKYQVGKASTIYYSKEKHQVVFVTGDTGGGEFATYKYEDGELKEIEMLVWQNGKFEEEGYTYNGTEISMDEGDEYIEKLKEQYQTLRGTM